MTTTHTPYWIVRVHLDGGAHVDHTFAHESDARYYLTECEGYDAEVIEK